jgi:hypothetical protein
MDGCCPIQHGGGSGRKRARGGPSLALALAVGSILHSTAGARRDEDQHRDPARSVMVVQTPPASPRAAPCVLAVSAVSSGIDDDALHAAAIRYS